VSSADQIREKERFIGIFYVERVTVMEILVGNVKTQAVHRSHNIILNYMSMSSNFGY